MRELARRGEELEALLAPEAAASRSEVTRETGVAEEALDKLERHGFVRARKSDGAASRRELRYGPCDVAVLRRSGRSTPPASIRRAALRIRDRGVS